MAHVPAGFVAVTDRARASELGAEACAGLAPLQREQYGLLWETVLDAGFQPSGLLVACLTALAPALGHTSATVPKRFGQFCTQQGLWVRVPGKLYPNPRGDVPGRRSRCYLVLDRAPEPDAAGQDSTLSSRRSVSACSHVTNRTARSSR